MINKNAVQLIGTLTVEASGSESIQAYKSNCIVEDLCLTIYPEDSNTNYTVSVYFFGELVETHTYPSESKVVAKMMYPTLFPSNVGNDVIPQLFDPDRKKYAGMPVLVEITSLEATPRTFTIYSLFKEWEASKTGRLS